MKPLLLLIGCMLAAQSWAQELSDKTFSHWRDYLHPKAQELAWQNIPWRPSFWEAAIEAQAKDKPILLWTMNGHPLGCT